ncbi:MAG: fatty acid desaturase, partial [Pseudomonadota bacterium]
LILVQPFLWFRAFHMAHHRHTGDPAQDPELASPKPRTWPELLWHLATLEYWRDKLTVLLQNAAGTPSGAYSSKRLRPRITWEARAYLAAYAALGAVGLLTPLGAMLVWAWLLPLAAGFPVLRLYLLAEHDGCPPVADMFRNTRTTFTDALTRRLAWNMPYHAEHHAWPMVPFHKLPDLHRHTRAHLKSTSPSYCAFTGALAKRL